MHNDHRNGNYNHGNSNSSRQTQVFSKSPYEIRLEILKLATSIASMNKGEHTDINVDDILKIAGKMNAFVSTQS